jgi:hypothetical protein
MNADEIGLRRNRLLLTGKPTMTMAVAAWGIVSALAAVWFFYSYGYFEDDGYIHLEFARSLVNGHGFAFHGQVTNGDTAPLWVLVLAVFQFLIPNWILAAKTACILGLVFALTGAWRLAADLPRETPAHALLPVAVILLTIANPFVLHWSFSGMEAVTALGLTFWVIWAVLVATPTPSRLLSATVLLALGPVLRPELMLFDAMLAPALLWRWNTCLQNRPLGQRIAVVAAAILVLALPVAIWCGYALHAFGSIVPNTNLAKRGGPIPELAVRLASVYLTGFPVTLLLLPVGLWHAFGRNRIPASVWILLLWPLACIAFYLLNHTLVQTRYCMLSMPSMMIGVLWLLGRIATTRAVIAAVAASLASAVAVNALAGIPQVANKKALSEIMSRISAYIRDQVPANAPVAVLAIGQIGFESQHPLIDVGGITQPEVLPYIRDPAAVFRWARRSGAQYFIGDTPPESDGTVVFAASLPYVGWSFRRSLYGTSVNYSVYKLQPR